MLNFTLPPFLFPLSLLYSIPFTTTLPGSIKYSNVPKEKSGKQGVVACWRGKGRKFRSARLSVATERVEG